MSDLEKKIASVRRRTILIHGKCPGTRVASSLSCVEIFCALHFGGGRVVDPSNPDSADRDRLIISKGHGSICMYPILADLGFFHADLLEHVGEMDSFLGGIPDPGIPGYETINGALGHGLGIAVGSAKYLIDRFGVKNSPKVFALISDGELYEGSTMEALNLGGALGLSNLCLVVDNNGTTMLDRTENIIPMSNLTERLQTFGWNVEEVDGHNADELVTIFRSFRSRKSGPFCVNAKTIKGKGVEKLESDPLSHIMNLTPEEVDYYAGLSTAVPIPVEIARSEKLLRSNF